MVLPLLRTGEPDAYEATSIDIADPDIIGSATAGADSDYVGAVAPVSPLYIYTVTATNNDNDTKTASVTAGADGSFTLTAEQIHAIGGDFTVSVTPVLAAGVAGVTVKTKPSTLVYAYNDEFDAVGLVLTLSLNDGATKDVAYTADNAADFAFSPATMTAMGTTSVTLTYEG